MAKVACLCTTSGTSRQLLVAFTVHLEKPQRVALMTSNITENAWRLTNASETLSEWSLGAVGSGSCTMDTDSGAFSVLLSLSPNGTSSTVRGLQYRRSEGWSSFAVGSYGWSGQSSVWWIVHEIGPPTFMHAYVGDKGTVHFALLRSGGIELTLLKTWTLNSTIHGMVDNIGYHGGQLVLFGSTHVPPFTFMVTKVPIGTSAIPDLTVAGVNTQIPFTKAQSSYSDALPNNRLYLLNRRRTDMDNSALHMVNGGSNMQYQATVQWNGFDSLSGSHSMLAVDQGVPSSSPSAATSPPTLIALSPDNLTSYRTLAMGPMENNASLSWSSVQSMTYFDPTSNQYVSQMPSGWSVPDPSSHSRLTVLGWIIGLSSVGAAVLAAGTVWRIRRRRYKANSRGKEGTNDREEDPPLSSSPRSSSPTDQPVELMEVKGMEEENGPPKVPPKDDLDVHSRGSMDNSKMIHGDNVGLIPRLPPHVIVAPSSSPLTSQPRSLPVSFAQPSAPLPIAFSSHPRPNVVLTMEKDDGFPSDDDESVPGYDEAGASQVALNRFPPEK